MTTEALLLLGTSAGLMLRVYVGLLLIGAAAVKVSRPDVFETVLAGYRLLPSPLVGVAARALPVIEALAGMALLAHIGGGLEMAGAALLLLLFAGGVAVNLLRGRRDLDCGCGGFEPGTIHWGMVGRNLLLAVLLLAFARVATPASLLLGAGAVTGGASLFLLHHILDLAMSLRRRAQAFG